METPTAPTSTLVSPTAVAVGDVIVFTRAYGPVRGTVTEVDHLGSMVRFTVVGPECHNGCQYVDEYVTNHHPGVLVTTGVATGVGMVYGVPMETPTDYTPRTRAIQACDFDARGLDFARVLSFITREGGTVTDYRCGLESGWGTDGELRMVHHVDFHGVRNTEVNGAAYRAGFMSNCTK